MSKLTCNHSSSGNDCFVCRFDREERSRLRAAWTWTVLLIAWALLMVLGGTGCFANGGWTKHDTALEIAALSALAYDGAQTKDVTAAGKETNPMLGAHGENMSLPVYFAGAAVIHLAVALVLPNGWLRTAWQAGAAAYELDVIDTNYDNGYRVFGRSL
jgi:hypothetical protein